MDKKEFGLFAMALKTYYPKENLLPNEQAMTLWYKQLEDIPYKVAEATLNKWVSTNKWSPSIADIRAMSVSVTQGEKPLWSDGWELTCRMIRKHGRTNAGAALAEMDEITRQTVKRLGWGELCISENIVADRANFRVIFEQLAERQQKEAQLPVNLHQLIEGIQREGLESGYDNREKLPGTGQKDRRAD